MNAIRKVYTVVGGPTPKRWWQKRQLENWFVVCDDILLSSITTLANTVTIGPFLNKKAAELHISALLADEEERREREREREDQDFRERLSEYESMRKREP